MALSRSDETDLLAALHEGMHERLPWATFLHRLRRRVGADAALLHISRQQAGVEIAACVDTAAKMRSWRLDAEEPQDPVPYARLRRERVYAADEFDPLPPEGRQPAHVRIVRVAAEDVDAWMSVRRRSADFAGSDASLLSALAPHLAIAVRNYAAIARADLRGACSHLVVERLGFGWIALSDGGRILEVDGAAGRLLAEGRLVRRAGDGRLLAPSAGGERLLEQALAALKRDASLRSRSIRLNEDLPVELLVTHAAEAAGAHLLGVRFVAYVSSGPPTARLSSATIAELFGLPAREARFAAALATGKGIGAAAQMLGLSVETARFYSKSLYAKTGARGEAELVRLLTGGVAALAPEQPSMP